MIGIFSVVIVSGQYDPKVSIVPEGGGDEIESMEVAEGDIIPVMAIYTDTTGTEQDVTIKWNSDPGFLAKTNKDDELIAGHAGSGKLFAKYKGVKDSILLTVTGIPKGGDEEEEDDDDVYPKVKAVPGSVKIAVGDSVELVGFYINEDTVKVEVPFTWSVEPAELGEFPDPSVSKFYASQVGNGIIIASAEGLADTIKLRVIEEESKPDHENNSRQIVINPGDTIVYADSAPIFYDAVYKTNGQKHEDAVLEWSMSGDPVGEIDQDGVVTLYPGETGLALVKATYSNFSASVELLVVDPEVDMDVNTISIHRVLPDGTELPPKNLQEGDTYKIGGLPFPLNILNGGLLHFPFGCIDEDIVIYMFIPEEYAETDEEAGEVTLDNELITGVKFKVMPVSTGEIVEDEYPFNVPLNLCLTFKHGLLDSLGVSPENLDVFFAENTGFVNDGVVNVTVDTIKNKIYAGIEHFSTIVVKEKSIVTTSEDLDKQQTIFKAYPNPFDTYTQIVYNVDETADVLLEIYSLTGQRISVLVDERVSAGTYSVTWDGTVYNGDKANSGIYICRMLTNGIPTDAIRLILTQ